MPKWMVKLTGHEFDLKALSKLYTEPECRVAKDDDGAYYLTRTAFDALQGFEVDAASCAWLPIVNDLMRLRNASYESVSLDGVYHINDDGTRAHHVFLSGVSSGRSWGVAEFTVTGPDGQPRPSPEPAIARDRLKLAEQDVKVREALLYWHKCVPGGVDICHYANKVYEIIREDMANGKGLGEGTVAIKRERWATSDELLNFGAWANTRAISGEKARHADNRPVKPGVTHYLNEGEAVEFIRRLLNRWFDWKVKQTP